MEERKVVYVDGREIPIEGERNLLELCRKANIEIPTFCYHSELSVYGACRLCLVDIEGRGIVTSCSTVPEPGMRLKTSTEEIREMRRIAVELLLANHDQGCPTCPKSATCKLQSLARRLGVREVRFKPTHQAAPIDRSSPSVERNPNRCILCGDCVRVCAEVQGIGAIDFAGRGAKCTVMPAFGRDLNEVECVHCGQCVAVCPTGALTPRSEVEAVWKDLDSEKKTVVAQIAPAVRVALGEAFGWKPGTLATGQIVAALRQIGFDQVYDTSFAADMTVLEEGTEFLKRVENGERMPQFTSCCPAWVKYAEQYYSDLLGNLSTCRSPQQMFGALAKSVLPERLGMPPEDLVVVSIMPCTAKKFEAKRPEFAASGQPDVDHVLTTQELARMIEEKGIDFDRLEPESLDMPLGFKTGAGVIFGSSGGVSEAVLRFAAEKMTGVRVEHLEFREVRGEQGLREADILVGEKKLKLAVVHGLANAKRVAKAVKSGKADYDLIEVMACPGGCVGGAGQPVAQSPEVRRQRAKGLYEADRMMQLHKSQDNPMVNECYANHLDEVGGEKAHHMLHTGYQSRRRMADEGIDLVSGEGTDKVRVSVCVGTNCFLRGSQDLLKQLVDYVHERGLQNSVDVKATFCFENCGHGPNVSVGERMIKKCTFYQACSALDEAISKCPVKT